MSRQEIPSDPLQRIKKNQPAVQRRPFFAILVMSVLLLAAWLLAGPVLWQMMTIEKNISQKTDGAVLFITGSDDSSKTFTLHRMIVSQTLNDTSGMLALSNQEDQSTLFNRVQAACQSIAEQTDCSDVWIVLSASAVRHIGLLSDMSISGLILFVPDADETQAIIHSGIMDAFEQPLLMIADSSNDDASRLFEWRTGEDALLFPIEQTTGSANMLVYQSTDGKNRLVVNPTASWFPMLNQLSPDVIVEMIAWMHVFDQPADDHGMDLMVQTRVLTMTILYRLFLSFFLLLLIPAAALLVRRVSSAKDSDLSAIRIWREGLFWLTAILMSVLLIYVMNRMLQFSLSWAAGLLLFSPGIHGWLHYGWQRLILADRKPSRLRSVPMYRLLISSVIALLLIVLMNLILSVFSLSAVTQSRIFLFFVMIGLGFGIGPAGSADLRNNLNQPQRMLPLWLLRRAIFWLVPIVLFTTSNTQSGWLAVLLCIWMIWADWLGSAVEQISQNHLLASIAESACLMSLMIPLIFRI